MDDEQQFPPPAHLHGPSSSQAHFVDRFGLPVSNIHLGSMRSGLANDHGPMLPENGVRENVGQNKRRNGVRSTESSVPRFAFRTRSDEDVLDDGYRWRKYGQKSVKNNKFPRSYYRCTHLTCNVKKQVQRLSKDNGTVITTYEGLHNHPSEKIMQTLTPFLHHIHFFSNPNPNPIPNPYTKDC